MNKLLQYLSKMKIEILKSEEKENHFFFEFRVVAKPGSKKERFGVDAQGAVNIYTIAKPVDGAANKAISKILGKKLGIAPSQLEMVQGLHSKHKRWRANYFFTDHKNVDYYCSKLNTLCEELAC